MAENAPVNVDTSAIPFLGLALQAHFPLFHNLTFTQIASYPDEIARILTETTVPARFVQYQYTRAFGASTPPSRLEDIMRNQVDHADNRLANPVEFAIMTPFMILFVALRLWSRKAVVGRIWWSDWLIVLGAVSTLFYEIIMMIAPIYGGGGKHMWDITWAQFTLNLKVSYACLCYYSLNILPVKLSLLFFYNTISQQLYYRWTVKIMVVLITVATIIFTLLNAFMCTPIGWYNDPANPNIKCMDKLAVLRAQGIVSFMTDLIILVLPVSVILRLQMGKFQKISVILLFFLGGLGAITSIIRLFTLVNYVEHTDYTYVEGDTAFWTILEAQIGIICCSAPALKALVTKYMPHLFSRSSSGQGRGGSGGVMGPSIGTVRNNNVHMNDDLENVPTSPGLWHETIINREPIPSRNSRSHKSSLKPDEIILPPTPRASIRSGNLSLSDITAVEDFDAYEMKCATRSPLGETDSVRQSDDSWANARERRVHDHV